MTDAGSLPTFITQSPKEENKNHAAITVTSRLSELYANPRPALGGPKCNDDSLTLSLHGKKVVCVCVCVHYWVRRLMLYRRDKNITSGVLDERLLCPSQCTSCAIVYVRTVNACVFVFIDGLNENKVRGERLFSGD